MTRRVYVLLQWIAVGVLAFCLPFSSFPLVAKLTGSSMVAPLSLLPLVALVGLWFIPYLLHSGKLPPHSLPLLAFGLAALLAGAAAFFLPFPAFKSAGLLSTQVKALATLAVGLCFYLVIAAWLNQPERICFLLRWINWSGVIVLGWSFFQGLVFYRLHTFPDWMWDFQGKMDTSLLLYAQRANGFAYEPSWLAHQLNMLYLPYWLAASATGFSAHHFHLWKLRFEHLLLLGGIGVLILSVSRIGLLTFLLMVGFLILLLNIRMVRWLQDRISRRYSDQAVRSIRVWTAVGSGLVLLAVYAGLLYGAGVGISHYDKRMQRLFDFSELREKNFMYYANQLVFAERVVFWQAGWEVFNDYPLLGVGLGNAGYFFPQKLSAFSWALTEVRTLMYQWTTVPNIKSLWVRLLAETGVVGFGLFLSWLYVLWQSAGFLRAQKDRLLRVVGLAGSFALIGFLVEGFSLDTFALPYYWISFAVLTAACELARRYATHPSAFQITGSSHRRF